MLNHCHAADHRVIEAFLVEALCQAAQRVIHIPLSHEKPTRFEDGR
jgi:hypothetical protein